METLKLYTENKVAEILLGIGTIHCNIEKPYIFTSGTLSPVYVDCRKLISFPQERREVIQLAAMRAETAIGRENIDYIAGGETAGIPFAAWLSEYFAKPMIYVRKKPKSFGRLEQVEGDISPGKKVLLVEDLTTDAQSKVNFCQGINKTGAVVEHILVIFDYGCFPGAHDNLKELNAQLHALSNWEAVLSVAARKKLFNQEQIEIVREFLKDPITWSIKRGGPHR